MDTDFPLISCLCITNNRVPFLQRAVRCFQAQTYINKELVIVYKENDNYTRKFVEKLKTEDADIVGYEVKNDPSLKLGDIRNKAIAYCNGAYFCNWDDDDWYNSSRLAKQYEGIQRTGQSVSLITNILIYDELEEQAYFSAFRFWEMSVLCKKSNINEVTKYASLQRSEDSFLIMNLLDSARIYPTVNPGLMIYLVHGSNTMNRPHFTNMFKLSQKLSKTKSHLIRDILSGRIDVEEGSDLLNSREFREELNYFYNKTGKLTASGVTVYGNKPID